MKEVVLQILQMIANIISSFGRSADKLNEPEVEMNYSEVKVEPYASKYYSSRESSEIKGIIIHDVLIRKDTKLESFDDVLEYFSQEKMKYKASAHYFVDKDIVVRMVNETNCAWHAGKALFNGSFNVNEETIGIELMNYPEGFTDFQYGWLAWKVRDLMKEHRLDFSCVSTHKIIRDNYRGAVREFKPTKVSMPAEKEDPRNFDWNRFTGEVFRVVV